MSSTKLPRLCTCILELHRARRANAFYNLITPNTALVARDTNSERSVVQRYVLEYACPPPRAPPLFPRPPFPPAPLFRAGVPREGEGGGDASSSPFVTFTSTFATAGAPATAEVASVFFLGDVLCVRFSLLHEPALINMFSAEASSAVATLSSSGGGSYISPLYTSARASRSDVTRALSARFCAARASSSAMLCFWTWKASRCTPCAGRWTPFVACAP